MKRRSVALRVAGIERPVLARVELLNVDEVMRRQALRGLLRGDRRSSRRQRGRRRGRIVSEQACGSFRARGAEGAHPTATAASGAACAAASPAGLAPRRYTDPAWRLPFSRVPIPAVGDLPDDVRARIVAVQEKAGFIPNVFLALAHRPDEFRAFFAYHDALMLKDRRPHQGRARDDRRRHVRRERLPLLRRRARRDPAHLREESARRRPGRDQLSQGRHHAAADARCSTSR